MVKNSLSDNLKDKADMVIIGKAVEYTPSRLRKGKGLLPAKIKFEVQKTLKGEKQSHVTAYWINGTFGESKSLTTFRGKFGSRTKVGLVFPKTYLKQCREIERKNAMTQKVSKKVTCSGELLASPVEGLPHQPWVVQGPCTDPFMFPAP
jgi:hypothetical protein